MVGCEDQLWPNATGEWEESVLSAHTCPSTHMDVKSHLLIMDQSMAELCFLRLQNPQSVTSG